MPERHAPVNRQILPVLGWFWRRRGRKRQPGQEPAQKWAWLPPAGPSRDHRRSRFFGPQGPKPAALNLSAHSRNPGWCPRRHRARRYKALGHPVERGRRLGRAKRRGGEATGWRPQAGGWRTAWLVTQRAQQAVQDFGRLHTQTRQFPVRRLAACSSAAGLERPAPGRRSGFSVWSAWARPAKP